jgi:hypothetical protein
MYALYPRKFVVVAWIMDSCALLPLIVDIMQISEMEVAFEFGEYGRDSFWEDISGCRVFPKKSHHLRQIVAPSSLGNETMDIDFLLEKLKERLKHCETVFGIKLPESP